MLYSAYVCSPKQLAFWNFDREDAECIPRRELSRRVREKLPSGDCGKLDG